VPGTSRCAVCGDALRPGYRLRGGEMRCLRHTVRHPAVLRRAFATALIVGTILTAINQGERFLTGNVTPGVLLKAALTYCVPFAVSTSGALGAARADHHALAGAHGDDIPSED
jgi:hypothetical protein